MTAAKAHVDKVGEEMAVRFDALGECVRMTVPKPLSDGRLMELQSKMEENNRLRAKLARAKEQLACVDDEASTDGTTGIMQTEASGCD